MTENRQSAIDAALKCIESAERAYHTRDRNKAVQGLAMADFLARRFSKAGESGIDMYPTLYKCAIKSMNYLECRFEDDSSRFALLGAGTRMIRAYKRHVMGLNLQR